MEASVRVKLRGANGPVSVMQTHQRNAPSESSSGQFGPLAPNPSLSMLKMSSVKPAGALGTYVRIAGPSVVTAILWSHLWIGYVASIVLVLIAILGFAALSRVGARLSRGSGWATEVSFGERIWLNRLQTPVPQDINVALTTLYLAFLTGTLVAMTGGLTASPILTGTGLIVSYAAMTVHFHKLRLLYRAMKDKNPLYRFWSYSAQNDNTPKAKARAY